MGKRIRLIFKNGVVQDVPYSAQVYKELEENMGKDTRANYKNFSVNTKEIIGFVFIPADNEE